MCGFCLLYDGAAPSTFGVEDACAPKVLAVRKGVRSIQMSRDLKVLATSELGGPK